MSDPTPTPGTQPLIEPDELAHWLDQPGENSRPVIIDVRWQLGRGVDGNRDECAQGHLPGAAFLDLETALAGPVRDDGAGGRHPLPSQSAATEALRAAGVTKGRPVVVYDGANSLAAARAWWVLQYFGKSDVRVLNGGYAAWVAAGLATETGLATAGSVRERGDVDLRPGAREAPTADDLAAYLESPGSTVIDARARERFLGAVEPMDPVAGHIPGALNLPTLDALTDAGRFDPGLLRRRLRDLGVDRDAPTALYCGSGVQAAHLALAMEVADPARRPPAVYVGSWSDWISDPQRPVAVENLPAT
ncbi:MAG: sulfurtransferase [Ornithinimicrobium sp.]